MDILLAHGHFLSLDAAERAVMKPYPPLGLLYLSAHLKRRGVRVGVFDATFSRPEDFRARLATDRPAALGLYCNLTTRGTVLEMIRAGRQAGCAIVLGGPEPANYPREYLERGADAVVVGEGELTLEELLPALSRPGQDLSGVEGIFFRRPDGEVVQTPPRPFIADLDTLPMPDREAVDLPRYIDVWRRHHGLGSCSLITSRGCPFQCTWCSHGVFGRSHRSRSPQNVADEVEWLRDRYRPDMLWYADDVFTINPRWFFAYGKELKRRNLVMPFETITREDRLDEAIVKELAELRCHRIWLGSESGSQRILDAMKRRADAARIREMVGLLKRHGIQTGLFVMLGFDGERMEDLEATVEHLKRADPDLFLTTVSYPIQGTPYFEQVRDRLRLDIPWEKATDRDWIVEGRPSRRFYEHATRWMRGELEVHRLRRRGGGGLRILKALARAKWGRLGMSWTKPPEISRAGSRPGETGR